MLILFSKPEHHLSLTNICDFINDPAAILPHRKIIKATQSGNLNFKSVSSVANQVLVYPNLTNESLLSIGKFYDDGCIVVFTESSFYVIKGNGIIVHGYRNHTDILWDVRLPNPTLPLNY